MKGEWPDLGQDLTRKRLMTQRYFIICTIQSKTIYFHPPDAKLPGTARSLCLNIYIETEPNCLQY